MRTLLLSLGLLALTLPAYPAARLTYPMSGSPTAVYWAEEAFPIRYKVDRRVVNAFQGAGEVVERAFSAWTAVPDADITFRNDGVGDNLRAGWDGVNTVSLADGLFRDRSFIAVTTNWYDNNGKMTEADIQLDADLMTSDYNIPLTIEHEIGHLLGLDHSAVISSVMYPFVGRGGTAALDSDDRVAIAGLYPNAQPELAGATLTGRVVNDSGGVFAAQVVALNDKGEPVATALTNVSGDFVLQPVPPGTYRLYAEPLDGPVDVRNLAGVWRQANVVSFPTNFCDQHALRVESGHVYGNLVVNTAGAPVRLNPRWIGTNETGTADFTMTATTASLKPGQTITIAVAGDGLTSGMSTFEVMNPGVRRASDFRYAGNYVYATFNVADDAPAGSTVVLVRSGTETATLTGALRVQGAVKVRAVARR